MKKLRHRSVLSIPLDDCKLDDLLEKLNKCKEQHPDQTLEVSFDCEGGYEYSGPTEMNIEFYELETDAEYAQRLEYEHEQLKEKELKELDRLLGFKKLNPTNQLRLEELMEKYHNG